METGPRGHVQDSLGAPLLEQPDEEIALALVAGVPVDQFVPLVDELLDVLLLVVVGFTDLDGIVAEILSNGSLLR